MSIIKWSDEYSVSIRQVDAQHKQLIALINQFHDAMTAGKAKDVMEKVFSELVTYTKFHFAKEEELLKTYNYPGLLAHKTKHDELTKKVFKYHDEFKSGKNILSIELMNFLKDWLVNHILGTDKQYSAFLNAKGVS